MSDRPRVFSDTEARRVFDAAIETIGRVAATIDGPDEFMQPLTDFGCPVDGTSVHFPTIVIDAVLDRIACARARQMLSTSPNRCTLDDAQRRQIQALMGVATRQIASPS
ncbi:MAG: hypothetical protein JXQ73_31810 [Phycisphaerae bacterium]|nr:hypothetical protein [Phycisphaerae bacterium]